MFKIKRISNDKFRFSPHPQSLNTFVFLTGNNGCGKSTLLLDILERVISHEDLPRSERHSPFSDFDFAGLPSKVITYSMTPFSKFDSVRGRRLTKGNSVERIGTSAEGGRYSLLFQAAVEFCRSSAKKTDLFKEISKIAGMSATDFRVKLRLDRSKIPRLGRNLTGKADKILKTLLAHAGQIGLYLNPGNVRLVYWPMDANIEATKERDVLPNEAAEDILEIIFFLRKSGALRVTLVQIQSEEKWRSADNFSSGQLSFFIGLMVLASSVEDNCLVLIDEPEISLHPAWQEKYCELLYKISTFHRGCYYFLATHSPALISATKSKNSHIFNLSEANNNFLVGDGGAISKKSIEEIFARYFDTLTPNNYLVKTTILKAVNAYSKKDLAEFSTYRTLLKAVENKSDDPIVNNLINEILKKNHEKIS